MNGRTRRDWQLAALPALARVAAVRAVAVVVAAVTFAGPAAAHGGPLGRVAHQSPTASTPLVLGAGVVVVLGSALLGRTATDLGALTPARSHWQLAVPRPAVVRTGAGAVGVAVLVGVVVAGVVGPTDPLSNPAVMVVWVGWWAGFAMSTYLVGNSWPAVNPWRAIARALPAVGRPYAWRWSVWPSLAGLLGLVWLTVVGRLVERPVTLAVAVLAYSLVTVTGSLVYGTETWFRHADPISQVFRLYGLVAPVGSAGPADWGEAGARDGAGARGGEREERDRSGVLALGWPGRRLSADVLESRDEAAVVLAVLWVTVYDGLVATPAWAAFARGVVEVGVPPLLVYLLAMVVGFGLFWGGYLGAVRLVRRAAATDVPTGTLVRRFAPPLLAIAVGYHFGYFLDYLLSLVPALVLSVTAPMATVDPVILVLPDWFGLVAVAAVLVGHVLATLTARTVAFDLESDRQRGVRRLFPIAVAMAAYTLVCLWVVTGPEVAPPFLTVASVG